MKSRTLKVREFPVVVEKDIDGSFFALAPSLQGCYTSGKTLGEALDNIKDAIKFHVADRTAAKETVSKRKLVSFTSVEVLA